MLAKFFITVSFFTLLSRIFGFIRDIIFAAFLGSSPLAQAFLVALKFPNFFRKFFAEGAFNAAFVPMFAGKLDTEGKEKAKEFAENIFAILLISLIFISTIVEVFMPFVLHVFAPGFVGDEQMFELTSTLARITFPYLMFISVATLFASILNSNSKFAAVAGMPILFNLSMIVFLVLLSDNFETPAHSLAWGVFASGILQIVWMLYNLKKIGFVVPFKLSQFKINEGTRKFFRKFFPGALGAGVTQVNLWVDLIIATYFSGAVAFLYYADRINHLPLSIIGTAMGTALLPTLSKNIASNDIEEANLNYNRSMVIVLLLTIPACFAFATIAEELIKILFERGEFTASDSKASANALILYSLGLPAFALVKVLSSCFFAMKDTKTPVISACYALIINIILNISFVIYFKKLGIQPHLGLALATTLAGWFNAIYLFFKLKSGSCFVLREGFRLKIIKILLAAFFMATSISYWFERLGLGVWQLISIVFIGVFLYFACIIMFRVIRISDAKAIIKKR